MAYMIKFLFFLLFLISFCNCSEKRSDIAFDSLKVDSTIISDPFKSYPPDIYSSIQENSKYSEFTFSGILSNVNIKKIASEQEDSIIFINSGFKGFNALLDIFERVMLPRNVKNLTIEIVYEYEPRLDGFATFEVTFYQKNTEVYKYYEKLEPSKDNYLTKTCKYKIPKQADNFRINLYTYDKKTISENLYPINPDIINHPLDSIAGFAYFSLNKIDISIDRKPIQDYDFDHSIPFAQKDISSISLNIEDELNLDSETRIISLGESVHGSRTFLEQENKIIKSLIEKDFTLIGFETPITIGVRLDEYIKGRRNDIDSILYSDHFNFYNNFYTKELFKYLRDYNERNNNKISVFGFDIPGMDDKYWSNTAEENLTDADRRSIEYLKNFQEQYSSLYSNNISYKLLFRQRDEVMSQNIFYIDESFNRKKKMVLVGHLGHFAKRDSPHYLAGHFLSKEYKQQYKVLGLFVGGGTILSQQYKGFDNNLTISNDFLLSGPIGKSIEQLCSELGENSFYINNIKDIELLDEIFYYRHIGAGYTIMQFEPIDVRKELDILWFTKESEGYFLSTKNE